MASHLQSVLHINLQQAQLLIDMSGGDVEAAFDLYYDDAELQHAFAVQATEMYSSPVVPAAAVHGSTIDLASSSGDDEDDDNCGVSNGVHAARAHDDTAHDGDGCGARDDESLMSDMGSVDDDDGGIPDELFERPDAHVCRQTEAHINLLQAELGVQRDDAATLLKAFKGDGEAALKEWLDDPIGVRQILGLLPTPKEAAIEKAISNKEGKIRSKEGEQKALQAKIKAMELACSGDTWHAWSYDEDMKKKAAQKELKDKGKEIEVLQHEIVGERVKLQVERQGRQAYWATNALPGTHFHLRAGMDPREFQLSRRMQPTRTITSRDPQIASRIFSIQPNADGTFASKGAEWHFRFAESQFHIAVKGQVNIPGANWTAASVPYVVTQVDVNENPTLELRYNRLRAEFFDAGKPIDEELVFHGTPDKNFDPIISGGFEVGGQGVGVAHGTAHGSGVYVARNPSVSMGYSRDNRRLLLCKILMGNTGKQGSSCEQDSNDVGWAIIAKRKEQVLPKYVVHWQAKHA